MKPARDSRYLQWIRAQPCAISGCRHKERIEANHTGPRGLSQKADDRQAIPLCGYHHRLYHDLGRARFETRFGLDINALIAHLNTVPLVTIIRGRYVATLNGEEWQLGPVADGPAKMIKALLSGCCRERVRLYQEMHGHKNLAAMETIGAVQ